MAAFPHVCAKQRFVLVGAHLYLVPCVIYFLEEIPLKNIPLRPIKPYPLVAFSCGVMLSLMSVVAPAHQRAGFAPIEDATVGPANENDTTPQLSQFATSAATASGCGHTGSRTGQFTSTTTDGKGKSRTYLVQVPSGYDRNNDYQLIFVFHGAGGNSSQAYSWGLQNAPNASENAIFVYPQGIPYQNYGVGWDDTKAGYDLPFFDNMVKNVEAAYCINTTRVFAAGFSWGGDFVTALACTRGAVVRAAQINSATDEFNDETSSRTYQNSPCPSTTHPAVRYQHAVNGDSEYPAPLFATSSRLFQRFNGCGTATTVVKSTVSGQVCVSHNTCTKQLIECAFPSSIGHNLPANWASDTWSYFQTFQ